MLRLTNKFGNLKISVEALNSNYQTVRWRKPRWIPIAKSKIFRVPKRVQPPLDEYLEMMRLSNNYRTQVKSLRRYFFNKYNTMFQKSTDPEEQKRIFEEDLARCQEINDRWNTEQKILREQRLLEKFEESVEFAKKRIEEEDLKRQKKLELVEEIVRKEKIEAKTFIMPENIDEAIEKALSNVVDYNFAINTDGSKIVGRETKPEKDVKERVKVGQ